MAGPTSGAVVTLFLLTANLSGQDLPLKRTLPDPSPGGCVGLPAFDPQPVGAADAQEASRLAAAATQAAILGDQEGARDFLERAAGLNPADEGIAYELARTLDALEMVTPAVEAYCRYLALAPGGQDAQDVRARVLELNPPDTPLTPQAQLAFARGVDAFDAGDLDGADREFTGALAAEPELEQAYYNRALVYAAERRYEQAIDDFRTYLDLTPGAGDADLVLERIGTLRSPPAVYNPATALVAGVFIPGFGQFHTDRPVAGLVVLTAAASAVGVALLYTETEVSCRTPEDPCPPNQVIDETTTRPFLVPGLAVAAAVTIGAAIEGFIHAKKKNAETAGVVGAGESPGPQGFSLLPPTLGAGPDGSVALELVRLRF
jgi:tetratricopeptide (TPR) repeat protein